MILAGGDHAMILLEKVVEAVGEKERAVKQSSCAILILYRKSR